VAYRRSRLRAEYTGCTNCATRHGHFWSPSYLAASCGAAPPDIIRQYIQQQRRPVQATSGLTRPEQRGLRPADPVIEDAEVVTYVVVCDPGDEAVSALARFARAERLEAAQVNAVGAFEHATVGWFDPAVRDYRRILVNEQCEVLSLLGDVAEGQDGPIVHVRVVLGLSDGTTRGGTCWRGRSSRRWRSW
jgi:uncharacterized protein